MRVLADLLDNGCLVHTDQMKKFGLLYKAVPASN